MEQKIKWYTEIEIVDVTTGEIITKSEYERRNYETKEKWIRNEFTTSSNGETAGIRKITWNTQPARQQRLQFE